jgi:hypothetical protein
MDLNKEKEKLELNKIINLSKKINFSIPKNAETTYTYIRTSSPMNSPVGLRFTKRLKEIATSPKDEYSCIICGQISSPTNYCFCDDCLQIHSAKGSASSEPVEESTKNSEASGCSTNEGEHNMNALLPSASKTNTSINVENTLVEDRASMFSRALYSISANDVTEAILPY